MDELRIPPHSIEAEQAVLGCLMVDGVAYDRIAGLLTEDSFYRKEHRFIYRAIVSLSDANSPHDAVTVSDWLEKNQQLGEVGGLMYLGTLAKNTHTTHNVKAYAKIVKEKATCRELLRIGMEIGAAAWEADPVEEKIEQAQSAVMKLTEKAGKKARDMRDVLTASVDALDRRFQSGGKILGLTTGFEDLDEKLLGIEPADLVIIAGRPSMGKTTFALNIVEHVGIKRAESVAVFSLEMPAEQLANRSICSLGRINFGRYRKGDLREEDWPRVTNAVGQIAKSKITIDDTPALSVNQIRARARMIKRNKGLSLIVVDYLQLMEQKAENRTQEITKISQGLKSIAKELNVPVIALSQLNRSLEQRANKRPVMSDLRESGAIEQDADIIIFLYRDEVYNEDSPETGIAEAIISKQRNGSIGTVKLVFRGEFCRFENYIPGTADNVKPFKEKYQYA